MQFERDPETSDTDNDVQFKVSSSFFLNSISGWDRGFHSHAPHPEMERSGTLGTKASHPCGEEDGATTCCQVFVSTKRGKTG